jgi:hypothetical protein
MEEEKKQTANSEEDQTPPEVLEEFADIENKIPEKSLADSNMEVHHHPEIKHNKKNWKEYILEGLMIFVAVMMGFVAENIREAITNQEHVKELVSQLVQDLKSDTAQLNKIYVEESEIMKANIELKSLLQKPLAGINIDRLQQLIVNSHSLWMYNPSAGAVAAIKSEIHLKQFSNSHMIGLIAGYEKHIDLIGTVQQITLQYQRMYIDPFLVNHFTSVSLDSAFNKNTDYPAQVRTLSQEDLTQLGSEMALVSINTNELIADNRLLYADASGLLAYVKGHFNSDEE